MIQMHLILLLLMIPTLAQPISLALTMLAVVQVEFVAMVRWNHDT